jgi:malonyl-CoA O-methyltransferase
LPLLAKKYANAKITGSDLAQGMLDHARGHFPDFENKQADAENLPFDDAKYDLIFSNFAVQWCDNFSKVLSEAFRCLKPGGHLVLSTLADGTLNELKQAWAQADQFQHVNDFEQSDYLKICVQKSEFNAEAVVVNTEFHYYATVRELTDSLKRIGAHNITQGRAKSLTSPGTIKKFTKALEGFRTEQGLPASYEVFTCVLHKPPVTE